ncbi:aminotransferase class I/II-fold pyridoxal phosphate-dependent enzyme [Vibrio sp. 10N.237.312.B06]|uniref:aminotransferase class I/II-fold pyridoxal phosphate-dependent enzyme n=1 Tax=Vibrio sp. 10N.237.312.B06 TaxID=3229974 RepID=UPI003552BAB0
MNKYANFMKMVDISMPNWKKAVDGGVAKIKVSNSSQGQLKTELGHSFINMSSCSYLGLNEHPELLKGAMGALDNFGMIALSLSRARIGHELVEHCEGQLSKLFDCTIKLTPSCTSASVGTLPLLASGVFTDGRKPIVIFDKRAHFSMNIMKPSCADETTVVTCEHNDIERIEEICKENDNVVYVCDGAYSTGGVAPFEELQRLQRTYGLFLYIDDSHSISCFGQNGIGVAKSFFNTLNERTFIIASLNKGFGSGGGVIMMANEMQKEILDFCGGPMCWSQTLSTATLGAISAASKIHMSDEISILQQKLRTNVSLFDELTPTRTSNNGLAIRRIDLKAETNPILVSKYLFDEGFYVSPLFFPIIPRDSSALRIMCRANVPKSKVATLCSLLSIINKD